MINANMKIHNYFTLGELDAYGQPAVSTEPKGTVKMSITNITTNIADNIKYKEATYIGLTLAKVDDTYIIENGEERLKVLYVIPGRRYQQVFLKEI